MIGALCGDFIGSVFEWHNHKSKEFELFSRNSRFTDDSVMTIATMDALLNDLDFGLCYRRWYRKYPDAGYGRSFQAWAADDHSLPYNSWGNGSAMRVSPVGCFLIPWSRCWPKPGKVQRCRTTTRKGSRAPRRPQPVFTGPCMVRQKHRLRGWWRRGSVTNLIFLWTRSGNPTSSMSPARGAYPRPLLLSWNQATTRTPSEVPFPSAVTAIPLRPSPGDSGGIL